MKRLPLDWQARAGSALVLAAIELISYIVLKQYTDDTYYLVAGGFNIAIVGLLSLFPYHPAVNDLMWMNVITAIFQWFGMLVYWDGYPVQIYNYSIHALSGCQVLRLFIMKPGDADGLDEDLAWFPLFFSHYFNRHPMVPEETEIQ